MVTADHKRVDDAQALSRSNRRFHKQLQLASHNRYLVQQLDLVYRSMALMASTSLAVKGRGAEALDEHQAIVTAIANHDQEAAYEAVRLHLSEAFVTRLTHDPLD